MKLEEFWSIVERVHFASPNDMHAKCLMLGVALQQIPLHEVISFEKHFIDCLLRANTWDIRGAAHIIRNNCSDDNFRDFRATLVSMGRRAFEAALANGDSLAELDIDAAWAFQEGYRQTATVVSRSHYQSGSPQDAHQPLYSSTPRGLRFNPEEMTPRFPRLVAKYNYKDVAADILRDRRRQQAELGNQVERVKLILLRGIIPSSGMVPPPRIIKQILASGSAPRVSGLSYQWDPFQMDEGAFWKALLGLQVSSMEIVKLRPDLKGKRIDVDTACCEVTEYEEWIQSLKERGIG